MPVLDLVRALLACSATLDQTGDKLRLTSPSSLSPELRAAVAAQKPALLEVIRRADAMRTRVPVRGPLPVLAVHDVPVDVVGCVSCGAPEATWRCEVCTAAAHLAIARAVTPDTQS